MMRGLVLVLLVAACSGGGSRDPAECEQIAHEIETAARARGIQTLGLCNSTDPEVQKDFAEACANLRQCNEGQ